MPYKLLQFQNLEWFSSWKLRSVFQAGYLYNFLTDFLILRFLLFFQIHYSGAKLTINTFVKHASSFCVFMGTDWGKMSVMTVGSFQAFMKTMTFTCVLQVTKFCSKPRFSCSLFEQFLLLWKTDMWGVSFLRIWNISPSLFPNHIYSIDFHGFPWLFIDFDWFS